MTTAVLHLVLPGHEIARALPLVGERIGDFLARCGWSKRQKINGKWRWTWRLPTVCTINGEYILQRQWRRRRIRESDHVIFQSRPRGFFDFLKNPVGGLVALIAVAAFAPLLAGPALGAIGIASGTAVIGALTFGQLFTAGAVIGGSLLINSLITPKAGGQSQVAVDVPQVYSLSAAGNSARLLETIPDCYGRLKRFPDFATGPWSEYVGDDQFLNVLLCEGLGKYAYEQLFIDDTVLWDADTGVAAGFEAQIEFYDPGETVTLFPADVTTSVEVSGLAMAGGAPGPTIGPFVANAAGSHATAIAFDYIFPGGCFTTDPTNGNLNSSTVQVVGEVREIDNAGAPLGSWTTVFTRTYTFATRQPKRISEKVTVGAGRYEARTWRATLDLPGSIGSDAIVWAGLRAYLQGDATFEDTTTIAIRIKADALTQGSSRKFASLATRVLPVWNGSAFADTATRSAVWAFYDLATNTDYGARVPVAKIDFQALLALAAGETSRGDTFDYDFRSGGPASDAFDTILRPLRARHCWLGDVLSVVRDEIKTVPRALLTDREIVRGSLSVGFAFNTEDSADAVKLEYLDEDIWGPASVQYPPDVVAQSPAPARIDGVVNRVRANALAAFLWRQSQFRRTTVALETEWEGKMLSYGSLVRVQSELPQSWGYAGTIVSRASLILTLAPAPSWADSGQHYIEVRTKRGHRWGPVKVSRGTGDNKAVLDGTDLAAVEGAQGSLDDALARADTAEPAGFAFGTAGNSARDCIVQRGQPNGNRVSLAFFVDDERVHDDDLADPPELPEPPSLRNQNAPLVINLSAIFRQSIAEPTIDVTWSAAPGAFFYNAEVSYDEGAHWTPVYSDVPSKFTAKVDYAALWVRVQAVGLRKGAWTQAEVEAPTIRIDSHVLRGVIDAATLAASVTAVFRAFDDRIAAAEETLATIPRQDSINWVEKQETHDKIELVRGDLGSSIDIVRTLAQNTDASLSAYRVTVDSHLGGIDGHLITTDAAVTTVSSALSTLNGSFATFEVDTGAHLTAIDGSVAGISSSVTLNATAIANLLGSFSSFSASINAQVGSLQSSVNVNANAIVTINGKLLSSYTIELNSNGYISGLRFYNDGSAASLVFLLDNFLIAKPVAGGDPVPIFAIAPVNGVSRIALRSDVYADGTINARAMNVVSLSAITANIGECTAGIVRSADSLFTINLDGRYILISDG